MPCECSVCAVRGDSGCELARRDRFVSTVSEMRNAQKEYFKTRSPDWLNRSKSLEREVDKMIHDLNDPQGDLFAGN